MVSILKEFPKPVLFTPIILVSLLLGEIDGQTESLLEILTSAQTANEGRYPQGEMSSVFTRSQIAELSFEERSEIHTVWSPEGIRSDVKKWSSRKRAIDPRPGTEKVRQQYILTSKSSISYNPLGMRVTIAPMVKSRLPDVAHMTPSTAWYCPLDLINNGQTWRKIIAQRLVKGLDPSKVQLSVSENADHLIEYRKRDTARGDEIRILFSLPLDGNVTEFTFKDAVTGRTTNGTCEWTRDTRGRLFLAKSVCETLSEHNGKKYQLRRTYETTGFNPDIKVAPSKFTLDSLALPSGVMIHDEITRTTRRTGDAKLDTMTNHLDKLIKKMKSQGFSTRDRRGVR